MCIHTYTTLVYISMCAYTYNACTIPPKMEVNIEDCITDEAEEKKAPKKERIVRGGKNCPKKKIKTQPTYEFAG